MPADPKKYTYHWKDHIVSHPEFPGGKPIIKLVSAHSGYSFRIRTKSPMSLIVVAAIRGYNPLNRMIPAPGRASATPAARNPQTPPTGLP